MVQFIEVDVNEISEGKEGHRGRVSYPILKGFLETGHVAAKLDRTGMQQSFQALYSSLNAYIRNHELPIKMFSRSGDIILVRLDLNADGTENPDWKEEMAAARAERAAEAPLITDSEVKVRFDEEKGQTTK